MVAEGIMEDSQTTGLRSIFGNNRLINIHKRTWRSGASQAHSQAPMYQVGHHAIEVAAIGQVELRHPVRFDRKAHRDHDIVELLVVAQSH